MKGQEMQNNFKNLNYRKVDCFKNVLTMYLKKTL